jgi:hypothetical protein
MEVAEGLKGRRISSERLAWLLVATLVTLHVVLAVLVFDPKPFPGGDNAGYMILAESIETGQGFRDIHLPGAPRHGQYPPVYPTILAIVSVLGGGLIAFKLLSTILTATSLVFLFMLARRRLGLEGGVAVVAAFAVNPVLVYYSHWVLSEALFVLLTLIALWASERVLDSRRWLVICLAFALLAYLTRAAGLPLVLALLVMLSAKREWRRLAVAGGATAALAGAWWIWRQVAAAEGAQVYSSNFLFIDPYDPELGLVGPGGLLARVVYNIRLYTVEVLPESLVGVAPGTLMVLSGTLASLLLIALALVAWVRGVRELRVLEVFAFFYATLIVLWPDIWTDRRFLLPLLPVAFLLAAAGVVWLFDFMRVRHHVWTLPAFGALLVVMTVPGLVSTVSYSQECMRLNRQGDELACYPGPWRAFAQAGYWVRDNTPEDVIVVSRKPRLFYLFSDRRGDVYPFTTEDEEMLAYLDEVGADYVLVVPLSATTYRFLVPVILSMPERFEIVIEVDDGETVPSYLLRYHSSSEPVGGQEGG